ncbi:MAG: ORF6N domain-containing protein, partial [Peptoniphilaceae bacterium]|nr:ORF6N domain-containing protein [Peptoniphilaceae bacterium]
MNSICVNNSNLDVKEFNGQRVVTFKDIDLVHSRIDGTARRNFYENKKHFIENIDYYLVTVENSKC